MYKISFYVPENEVEQVKAALFKAGAGKIGQYSNCAWQVKLDFMKKFNPSAYQFSLF